MHPGASETLVTPAVYQLESPWNGGIPSCGTGWTAWFVEKGASPAQREYTGGGAPYFGLGVGRIEAELPESG
jgi:hypothetical protein